MVGLIRVVYNFIGWMSDPSDRDFIPFFHESLDMIAYMAAKGDNFKETKETYWNAAKAYVALTFTTDKNLPKDYLTLILDRGYFMPPREELPLSPEDAAVVANGVRFGGCHSGECMRPLPRNAIDSISNYVSTLRRERYEDKKAKK